MVEPGEVWDLDGTIVLVLERPVRDMVKCFTLDEEPGELPDETPVDTWALSWFSGKSRYNAVRLT